jgi:glutamate carboxypeptidase
MNLAASLLLVGALGAAETEIAARVDEHLADDIALLQKSVDIPSATQNLAGVRAVGDLFRAELDRLGFATTWIAMPAAMKRAGHLVGELRGTRGKRLLLIGHLDTVVEGQRFVRSGASARGIGATDMKGGDVIVLAALRALHDAGALRDLRMTVYFTGDEEDPGQPLEASREHLVAAAKKADAALAFEAIVRDTATVARRGVTTWTLKASGKTAHSAGIFDAESGAGAVFELARILDGFYGQVRGEKYLTFNPRVVVGGTDAALDTATKSGTARGKTNVIAQTASAAGDLRFISNEQRESAKAKMRAVVERHLPLTSASIQFVDTYPAMSPTQGNYALLAALDQASRDLGFGPVPTLDPGERGAGDVSFVAPFVDSLDGLGARGSGTHTPDETVDLDAMPMLIKRTALFLYRLTR